VFELEERFGGRRSGRVGPRMGVISGPQGPRVLLDGRPVLLLCSDNALGFADHPRVREAASDAAVRWGAGTGSPRLVSGYMTVHRRLEERLAEFHGAERCVLFPSGSHALAGVIGALTRPGDVIFSDAANHPAVGDACRLSDAETLVYDHGDLEHLAFGLGEVAGRGTLIVTDGVFALQGDVAPLEGLVELARGHEALLVVNESLAVGAVGRGGRGAVAAAGLEDEVDVVVSTLGKALGAYGGYSCGARGMARLLVEGARPLLEATSPPPPAVAGALAALELLRADPERVERLARNARVLREALMTEGLDPGASSTHVMALGTASAPEAVRAADFALERGVVVEAARPEGSAEAEGALRLAVMSSHTRRELRAAAAAVAEALAAARPATGPPRIFDALARAA
jgi:glycine C-acetyltransferase/8-amino-7-oxononanoate synthase